MNNIRVLHVGHDDFLIITDKYSFRLNKESPLIMSHYGNIHITTKCKPAENTLQIKDYTILGYGYLLNTQLSKNDLHNISKIISKYISTQKYTNLIIHELFIAIVAETTQLYKKNNGETCMSIDNFGWIIVTEPYDNIIKIISDNFKKALLSKEIEYAEIEDKINYDFSSIDL